MFKNKITVVSVAPSFPIYFSCHPLQFVEALKLIGFTYVEETVSVLPEIVSKRKEALNKLKKPLLSESCPRIIDMIEREFPKLIKNIAPVPSPMELHGKKLREKYGNSCYTVFISPCLHKKRENERKKVFDEVLTFKEVSKIFEKNLQKPLSSLKKNKFDSEEVSAGFRLAVLFMSISGIEYCRDFLKNFEIDRQPSFTEIVACKGGCAQRALVRKSNNVADLLFKAWEEHL